MLNMYSAKYRFICVLYFVKNISDLYLYFVKNTYLCSVKQCKYVTRYGHQLHSAGLRIEYEGIKTGDFRVNRDIVIEVGGPDKSYKQVQGEANAYLAVDGIDSATSRRIPLWAFGFLY